MCYRLARFHMAKFGKPPEGSDTYFDLFKKLKLEGCFNNVRDAFYDVLGYESEKKFNKRVELICDKNTLGKLKAEKKLKYKTDIIDYLSDNNLLPILPKTWIGSDVIYKGLELRMMLLNLQVFKDNPEIMLNKTLTKSQVTDVAEMILQKFKIYQGTEVMLTPKAIAVPKSFRKNFKDDLEMIKFVIDLDGLAYNINSLFSLNLTTCSDEEFKDAIDIAINLGTTLEKVLEVLGIKLGDFQALDSARGIVIGYDIYTKKYNVRESRTFNKDNLVLTKDKLKLILENNLSLEIAKW